MKARGPLVGAALVRNLRLPNFDFAAPAARLYKDTYTWPYNNRRESGCEQIAAFEPICLHQRGTVSQMPYTREDSYEAPTDARTQIGSSGHRGNRVIGTCSN